MNYFVTGATGFIGRFFLGQLLCRPDAQVYALVRPGSRERFARQLAQYGEGAERVHVVVGDITRPGLMDPVDAAKLRGRVDHVFHLAAVYDMEMSDEVAERVNRQGTRYVVDFTNELGGGVMLHHVSSIAVAGPYFKGLFEEGDFEVGQALDHPYYRSKFEAEKVVREHSRVPTRIYRPGIVVGDSRTGEIDKIDGPYYFFSLVRLVSRLWLLPFVPILMFEGGRIPIVPVDYVVKAMDAIAHRTDVSGDVFCLVPSEPPSVGELVQRVFRAAGGPPVWRIGFAPAALLGYYMVRWLTRLMPARLTAWMTRLTGIPVSVVAQLFGQTRFDDRQARAALGQTSIACPAFPDYVQRMWQGWERGYAVPALPRPDDTPADPCERPA